MTEPKQIIIDPSKTVEVKTTDKHPGHLLQGGKANVPEHMIPHLVKKGMIEDPNKAKK